MNAKEEFIKHIGSRQVLCADIVVDTNYGNNSIRITLKVGHSTSDFDKFLGRLDFEYDAGDGSQELYGIIWYEGGAWSGRYEYDGSEWREYRAISGIPDYLE